MKLKDLLKVCSYEFVLKSEIHDITNLFCKVVYVGNVDDRQVLARYLDYFVVCIEENNIVTIKGIR